MFQLGCASKICFKNEMLSGLTVALALVPEAVAFSFVAGVDPLVGLYAAFMVGLLAAVFGGRPGMISGATGAMAVVMVSLVAEHGVEYLFAAVVLTGLIQISVGLMKLGKYIRIVPHPVMLGFVNGLAIVIFLAQLQHFQFTTADGSTAWMSGESLMLFGGLILLTMMIIQYLPKLTGAFPASLAAILVVSLMTIGLDLDTKRVADLASIEGGFPSFHLPMVSFSWETLYIILPYAVILAAVGLIESLLTLTLIDEVTDTRGQGNRECIGQGIANTTTGLFGGMGGCAMIGQSMINVNSGGRQRLSGISAALFLLSFILFASSLIEMIPMAALVGVMFMVVLGTFEWSSLRIMNKIPAKDAFVLILVSGVTVATDLAIAVIVGVIVSALIFAWEHASHINIEQRDEEGGLRIYELNGPLFFGSVKNFLDLFDPKSDPDEVIIEFKNSRVADHSAIEAIDTLAEKYMRAGKQLHLRHLSPECRILLHKAGDLVEVNMMEDPTYHVADDQLA
ncbi:MAG: SulP family inorganic anion transporter [Gammaproteobacteria bacterium]|jgi:SulP family sulfate permease|nr:SulP family inorganic anion transporter [Gammaproteobacteria bacterium]MBT4606297.1 SulP family inorganic anion transporter [Thiotrichales bacterium]MBT3473344.1 SulP family inorganic anion transporter [Gammaproteobacteria bacterium]MBT3966480.1 SulP family inorganic anion transporter [Gammaproteobacteria bacterium]MBT4079549.1 SulP family inorganic anion transporter [Gammaproteobacteria bacterium]